MSWRVARTCQLRCVHAGFAFCGSDTKKLLAPMTNCACYLGSTTGVAEDEVHRQFFTLGNTVEAVWVQGVEDSDPGAFFG